MDTLIQRIQNTCDKKQVQSCCKKILKKMSFKSGTDIGNLEDLAFWLYIYGRIEAALAVCDLVRDVPFTGNYSLWDRVDTTLCLKARILRESGCEQEAGSLIEFINQYRHPALYRNIVPWFTQRIPENIQSAMSRGSKAGVRDWRLNYLRNAVRYLEPGGFPLPDDTLERVIADMCHELSKEK